jgi:hypothetical protein
VSNSNPNRRLPKQVYRRRQIGCLLVIALLVAVIWGIVALANGVNSLGKTGNPGATNTTASTAGAGEACAPGAIVVKPFVTDQTTTEPRQSFGSKETPYFGFTLKNIGAVDCSFNVGSAQQFYSVTSGAEVYWSSKDCDRSGTLDMMKVIKVGESLSSQATSWDRVRSSTTGCNAASGQSAVPAGGATFHLNVSVAGVLSDPGQGSFILR